jgi:hypothetical protein
MNISLSLLLIWIAGICCYPLRHKSGIFLIYAVSPTFKSGPAEYCFAHVSRNQCHH